MTWQQLEENVRSIASYIWNRIAIQRTIAGVKCDCIIELELDNWIMVEVSKSDTLEKLRTDISKFGTVKPSLMSKGIYTKLYFVTQDTPTDSLRDSGSCQNVTVMSIEEFKKLYFDYPSYIFRRSGKTFGSLINLTTGEPELSSYINVQYFDVSTGQGYSIFDITGMLKKGRKIVLKGNFGTGKSRCVKQLFDTLSSDNKDLYYTIAINLREHWGAKRAEEIIDRHFSDIGINIENFRKSFSNKNMIYLLDGFDEIGTQSWSVDKRKMHAIRNTSVVAIKDFIMKAEGGILLTGREHFFNSDDEMLQCFDLSNSDCLVLQCKDEFSEDEIVKYLEETHSIERPDEFEIPQWLPRRPLIVGLALNEAPELFFTDNDVIDECDFWFLFLNKLCQREANINPLLNCEIIKDVMLNISRITRSKPSWEGPITMNDLETVFEASTGLRPTDESAIMLQRLPGLGRIAADSPDRQFIDTYILNGLNAEDIIQCVTQSQRDIMDSEWKNPLNYEGIAILSAFICKNESRFSKFLAFALQSSSKANVIIASDILSALVASYGEKIDLKGLTIRDSHITNLFCENKALSNLYIDSSIIEILDITNASFFDNCTIENCIISEIVGVPSETGMPKQFLNNVYEKFESISTVSRISKAKLSASQKIFVTIIKKTFFQPGAGRKEEALLRGLGAQNDMRITRKVLSKLLDEKILEKHKGDEGWIYGPVRKHANRINKILSELTMSNDPLWEYVTQLR